MRLLSRILSIAILAMALVILPLGCSTLIMAFQLGLVFDGLSVAFMLCLYIAFSIYEVRELICDIYCIYNDSPAELQGTEVISNENVSDR